MERKVTLVFVDEEADRIRLLLGSGKTFVDAIDAAALTPGADQLFDNHIVSAVLPGHVDHNGLRALLRLLLEKAERGEHDA